MSLQVYFGETLIDEQYYTGLTNNNELFNDSFKLGSTPCNTFKLSIAKDGVSQQPSEIILKDGGVTFANLQIDNIEEQDYEYVYTLTDKMLDLEFKYDASESFQNGSTNLLLIAQDICTKVGLTLGTVDFRGYNKSINWYDNTRTAREYIGMIAELNGGFARIENNTLYFRKQNTASAKTIDIDDCENFNIGEYHKITRVIYELGALKYEFGDETGNTLYLNSENVYITEESEVQAIYNEIKDFEFYSFETSNCPIDYSVKAGDVITFTDGTNDYPTIAQYDLEYFGDWLGGYKLDINTERQEETKIIGEKERIRDIKITVDRQNNTITQVVSEVDEQNTKIAQTQQTVNELNSKIQDIADITTQAETIYATLDFDNINQSEPIEVKIHPTTTNISYLYPRSNLYPNDTLYMPNRVLRFTNTDTSEVFDYELPDDLLINPNTGTYDEFYLGYDEQICQVTKRCEYNADGTVSDLANEVINSYTYPIINLTDGDYTIELLGYNNAYMSIRLMAQNIYTTQFATKAELNSEISQTAQSITSTVSATYETKQNAQTNYSQLTQTATSLQSQINSNDTDISTLQQTAQGLTSTVATKVGNNEVISKINQSAEAVTINANKINLNGKNINLTSDNIAISSNNFNVDKYGNMTCNNASMQDITIKNLLITGNNMIYRPSNSTYQYFKIEKPGDSSQYTQLDWLSLKIGYTDNPYSNVMLYNDGNSAYIEVKKGSSYAQLTNTGVHTYSQAYRKKDFEKLENALDEIKKTDIYKYHYKEQNENEKKSIGMVIGKDFNYSSLATVTDNNGEEVGISDYSMIGIAWKAIQEQQEQIEQLQKEIKELKGEKENDKN